VSSVTLIDLLCDEQFFLKGNYQKFVWKNYHKATLKSPVTAAASCFRHLLQLPILLWMNHRAKVMEFVCQSQFPKPVIFYCIPNLPRDK